MATAVKGRRDLILAAAVIAAIVILGVLVLTSFSDDDNGDAGSQGGSPATATSSSSSTETTTGSPGTTAARAIGQNACAFLSLEDIQRATGAQPVELSQMVGPSGNPGCEWVVGPERAALQLEFVGVGPGPRPTLPSAGEDVTGPWEAGKWVPAKRSIYVDRTTGPFYLRVSDPDVGHAKEVAMKVALEVVRRNN